MDYSVCNTGEWHDACDDYKPVRVRPYKRLENPIITRVSPTMIVVVGAQQNEYQLVS